MNRVALLGKLSSSLRASFLGLLCMLSVLSLPLITAEDAGAQSSGPCTSNASCSAGQICTGLGPQNTTGIGKCATVESVSVSVESVSVSVESVSESVPEMSDYLAIAFIIAASAITIYRSRNIVVSATLSERRLSIKRREPGKQDISNSIRLLSGRNDDHRHHSLTQTRL